METDYDLWQREQSGETPVFAVGGQKFTARARIPHKGLQKALKEMNDVEEEADANDPFFNLVLKRADRARFIALLHNEDDDDDEAVISTTQVNKIVSDLLEFFTGKTAPKGAALTDGPMEDGDSAPTFSIVQT